MLQKGQWLWLSRQSCRFRYRGYVVKIKPLAKFYKEHVFSDNCSRDKNKKEAENGSFKKKTLLQKASRSTATAWQQRLCCLTLCTNDREREREIDISDMIKNVNLFCTCSHSSSLSHNNTNEYEKTSLFSNF